MPILHLVIVLALIGFGMWALNKYVPMQPTIKKVLNIAVIIAVILWLLSVFGILPNIANIHVGK
jgi:hypothetical protein